MLLGCTRYADLQQECSADDQDLYAADILYIATLGISKAATIFLIARLTRLKSHILACHVIAGLVAAWTVASILTVAIRCNKSSPWLSQNNATCLDLVSTHVLRTLLLKSQFSRWATVEAIGMALEVTMLGLATHIILHLQMPMTRKLKGIFAFTTRLP